MRELNEVQQLVLSTCFFVRNLTDIKIYDRHKNLTDIKISRPWRDKNY